MVRYPGSAMKSPVPRPSDQTREFSSEGALVAGIADGRQAAPRMLGFLHLDRDDEHGRRKLR